jgi:hypothetical protein
MNYVPQMRCFRYVVVAVQEFWSSWLRRQNKNTPAVLMEKAADLLIMRYES